MDGNVINYSQIDRHKEALENTSKNKEQEQEKKSRIDLLRSLAKNTQSESEGHTVDGRIKNGPSSSDTKSSGDASTSHEASDREVQISAQPKERRQKIEKMMQEFAHIDKQYQQMSSKIKEQLKLEESHKKTRAFRNSDKQSIFELKWLPLLPKFSLFSPKNLSCISNTESRRELKQQI